MSRINELNIYNWLEKDGILPELLEWSRHQQLTEEESEAIRGSIISPRIEGDLHWLNRMLVNLNHTFYKGNGRITNTLTNQLQNQAIRLDRIKSTSA
jgi:hypothetical protein